jgi:hypothetical protein
MEFKLNIFFFLIKQYSIESKKLSSSESSPHGGNTCCSTGDEASRHTGGLLSGNHLSRLYYGSNNRHVRARNMGYLNTTSFKIIVILVLKSGQRTDIVIKPPPSARVF